MNYFDKWVRQCLGKKKYHTFAFANKIIARIRKEKGLSLNTYQCPRCQGFHLTKQEIFERQDLGEENV